MTMRDEFREVELFGKRYMWVYTEGKWSLARIHDRKPKI